MGFFPTFLNGVQIASKDFPLLVYLFNFYLSPDIQTTRKVFLRILGICVEHFSKEDASINSSVTSSKVGNLFPSLDSCPSYSSSIP